MAKKESSNPKNDNTKKTSQESFGDKISPKSWQPTVDRTTTPPKGNIEKK